jgi:hypothetical protein
MGHPQQQPNRPKEGFVPNPKLKLLDQCREVMRYRHLSRRSEETYLQWIRRFILFHRKSAAVTDAPLQWMIYTYVLLPGGLGVRNLWMRCRRIGDGAEAGCLPHGFENKILWSFALFASLR